MQEHSEGDADHLPAPAQKARTRRGAVSGSVMTEEQATSYVKKVGPIRVLSFTIIFEEVDFAPVLNCERECPCISLSDINISPLLVLQSHIHLYLPMVSFPDPTPHPTPKRGKGSGTL